MKPKLDNIVAAAVGAMLVGRDSITLEDVQRLLPPHVVEAGPSLKSMTKALASAGWVGQRHDGGAIVYVSSDAQSEAAPVGHNGCGGSVAADEVRLLIKRAERLRDEQKAIGDDIKDVWAEAKSRGHDVPSLKEIMRLRGKKKDDVHGQQAVLEVYLRAMGMMA